MLLRVAMVVSTDPRPSAWAASSRFCTAGNTDAAPPRSAMPNTRVITGASTISSASCAAWRYTESAGMSFLLVPTDQYGEEGADTIDFGPHEEPNLAGAFGIPVATEVVAFSLESGKAVVECEAGGGERDVVELELPCVIGAARGLNEPRYPKLPDIMKAKRKPLEVIPLGELGVVSENDLQFSQHTPPPVREKGIMVEDTAQLVAELKNRGLV